MNDEAKKQREAWLRFLSHIEKDFNEGIRSEEVLTGDRFVGSLIELESKRLIVWKSQEGANWPYIEGVWYYLDAIDLNIEYCYIYSNISDGTEKAFISNASKILGIKIGNIDDEEYNDEVIPELSFQEGTMQTFVHGLSQFIAGPFKNFFDTQYWLEGCDINANVAISDSHYAFFFSKAQLDGKYDWPDWFFREWTLGSETILYMVVLSDKELPAAFARYCINKLKKKSIGAQSAIVTALKAQLSMLEVSIEKLKNELKNLQK